MTPAPLDVHGVSRNELDQYWDIIYLFNFSIYLLNIIFIQGKGMHKI